VTTGFNVGITIRRPRPEVASVMFDLAFLPLWRTGVRSVAYLSGTPPEVGATVVLAARRKGEEFEIVEHQHNLNVVLESDRRTITLALEGAPVGTIAWLGLQTERSAFGQLLAPLWGWRARRRAIADLRRLKRLIESGAYKTALEEPEPVDEDPD
jgi:hypothetical protein